MTDGKMIRRLAAILALDVVGYSRMMGLDEEWTLAALKRFRREVTDPAISETSGRIFKTMGDGLLIEFQSVFDAFACALRIQDALAAQAPREPGRPDFQVRIGIDIGDIMDDGEDIFGEGVNIAARIEPLAAPGGICVSGRAWEDLRRLPVHFTDLGGMGLKNISNPIAVYAYAGPKDPAERAAEASPVKAVAPGSRFRWKWPVAAAGALGVVVAIVIVGWMNDDIAQTILPSRDPRVMVENTVAAIPCSWLELSGYSREQNGNQIAVRGAHRAPDILEETLRRELTQVDVPVGRIDVSEVAPIYPKQCRWIEAIRSQRHVGLPYFKASIRRKAKYLKLPGIARAFSPDRLDRFVIQFDDRVLPVDLAIFSIDSAGMIHFVANKAQFTGIARPSMHRTSRKATFQSISPVGSDC